MKKWNQCKSTWKNTDFLERSSGSCHSLRSSAQLQPFYVEATQRHYHTLDRNQYKHQKSVQDMKYRTLQQNNIF